LEATTAGVLFTTVGTFEGFLAGDALAEISFDFVF